MIPSASRAKDLWEKYQFPPEKRRHAELVSRVAGFIAEKLKKKDETLPINEELLRAGALLHDIDKNAPKLAGERHPETAVRILKEEGMAEVARLVATHPLHAILDPAIAPRTWEEKILFLSDKMVKHEIITVDERVALWKKEDLPQEAYDLLERTYPKVKELEQEIFSLVGVEPEDVKKLA